MATGVYKSFYTLLEKWEKQMKDFGLKDSGDREVFTTGSNRDTREGKGRFDLISPRFLKRLALVLEKGCHKYGERNWEKGQPLGRYLDSAMRHITQLLNGMTDEDHAAQAAWNLHSFIHTWELIEEEVLPDYLDDIGITADALIEEDEAVEEDSAPCDECDGGCDECEAEAGDDCEEGPENDTEELDGGEELRAAEEAVSKERAKILDVLIAQYLKPFPAPIASVFENARLCGFSGEEVIESRDRLKLEQLTRKDHQGYMRYYYCLPSCHNRSGFNNTSWQEEEPKKDGNFRVEFDPVTCTLRVV